MSFTTDPNDPRLGRGIDTAPRPQNEVYLVLSEEERAKGFVRPFRNKYVHVGFSICGRINQSNEHLLGGDRLICAMRHEHDGECFLVMRSASQPEQAKASETHRWGGCGGETKMGDALCETYARNPKFYGATYCVHCGMHKDVAEFVWSVDGAVVGS